MIKKNKNGSYTVRLFYNENGKKKSINKTFPQKKVAERWELDMNLKKATDSLQVDDALTISDYFWKWFITYKKANLAPATIDRYKTTFNYLKKALPSVKLAKMNRIRYQEFINEYADQGHSKSSVSKMHVQISAAIKDALDDGIVEKDFTARINIYGNDGVDPDTKFLGMKDIESLTDELSNSEDVYNISPAMIYTSLLTGMRLSEVQGLTEDYFFPQFNRIQVVRTLDRNLNFKPTKNKQSERIIDIPQRLTDYLSNLIEMQHRFNKHENPERFIFMNTRGNIPSSHALADSLKKILLKINASKIITFHGLRHSHASYLLAKGLRVEYVSKRLGHQSIETTISTYQHMMPEIESNEKEKAINLLENIRKEKKSKSSSRTS